MGSGFWLYIRLGVVICTELGIYPLHREEGVDAALWMERLFQLPPRAAPRFWAKQLTAQALLSALAVKVSQT